MTELKAYFNLARARQSMPMSWVTLSATQFPEDMKASRVVGTSGESADACLVAIPLSSSAESQPAAAAVASISPSGEAAPAPTADSDVIQSSPTDQRASGIRDPLRYFGVLVPPVLREAQSSFVTGKQIQRKCHFVLMRLGVALSETIRIAHLQAELAEALDAYETAVAALPPKTP
jgi:hypothetical protein